MPRRNKIQIIALILELCLQSDMAKNRIARLARMQPKKVNLYLKLLTRKGLLEAAPGRFKTYKTTPSGKEVIESLKAINETLQDD